MSFTQQEYKEMRDRALANAAATVVVPYGQPSPHPTYDAAFRAAVPKRQWNKTEEAFSRILDARVRAGEIIDWRFEGITFKLGRDCRYTPDFAVFDSAGRLHLYEVKGGHVRDDAQAKFRMAAAAYPCLSWWWAQYKKGRWTVEQEPAVLRPGRTL